MAKDIIFICNLYECILIFPNIQKYKFQLTVYILKSIKINNIFNSVAPLYRKYTTLVL